MPKITGKCSFRNPYCGFQRSNLLTWFMWEPRPAQPKRAIDFSALRESKVRLYLWSLDGIGPSPFESNTGIIWNRLMNPCFGSGIYHSYSFSGLGPYHKSLEKTISISEWARSCWSCTWLTLLLDLMEGEKSTFPVPTDDILNANLWMYETTRGNCLLDPHQNRASLGNGWDEF